MFTKYPRKILREYQFEKNTELYIKFREKLVAFLANMLAKQNTKKFYTKTQDHETYYYRQYLIHYLENKGYPDNDIIKFQSHYSIEDITYIIQNKK